VLHNSLFAKDVLRSFLAQSRCYQVTLELVKIVQIEMTTNCQRDKTTCCIHVFLIMSTNSVQIDLLYVGETILRKNHYGKSGSDKALS